MEKKKLVILIGKTATGKSAIEKKLCEDEQYHRCISYTTRPKRDHEKNNVDYIFVDDQTFDKYQDLGYFLDSTSYTVNGQTWRYAVSVHTLAEAKVNILVVNPDGLNQIIEYNKVNKSLDIYVIKVEAGLLTTLKRYAKRDGKNATTFQRLLDRLDQDDDDFSGIITKLRGYEGRGEIKGYDILFNNLNGDEWLATAVDSAKDMIRWFLQTLKVEQLMKKEFEQCVEVQRDSGQ